MPRYKYLIIGGGMTAAAAIAGIREVDPNGTIGVIAAEPHRPYDRPPLSKALWKGTPANAIWRKIKAEGVTFHLGRTARHLDAANKRVTDDQGEEYAFDRLLLATGCTPRRLPFGGDDLIYFRTVDDYQRLRRVSEQGQKILVIGGGFIGSEISAALALNGKQVTLAFHDHAIGARMYPAALAEFLNGYYREKGVEVLSDCTVTGCERRDGKMMVTLRQAGSNSDLQVSADGVVAGIGVTPSVDLAAMAGLAVDDGIRVDSTLRTSNPEIFAAGDVASFYNPALDRRLRVEHEDNANTMGRLAGRAMAGDSITYDQLPFFYSDLFDLGYEAVGETDSRLETFIDWKDPNHEGVVYYLKSGRVRGVLLWGIFGQVDAARALIASDGPYEPADLRSRIGA